MSIQQCPSLKLLLWYWLLNCHRPFVVQELENDVNLIIPNSNKRRRVTFTFTSEDELPNNTTNSVFSSEINDGTLYLILALYL